MRTALCSSSLVFSLALVTAAGCGGGDGDTPDAAAGAIDADPGAPDAAAGSWVVYQAGDVPLGSVEGVIMLSNFTSVSRNGATWALAPTTSVAANVIHADESVLSHFYRSDDSRCLVYEDVTAWNSHMGVTPFTIESSTQTATATWNGTRYQVTGLVAGPGFGSVSDAMSVTAAGIHDGVGGPLTPPFTDANQHLGAPAGLATIFSMPDAASFAVMFTFAYGTGPGGGEYGVMCEQSKAEMTLTGQTRSAPLVDAAAIARLAERGVVATGVNVAVFQTQDNTTLFPGQNPIRLQAGQMMTISAAALGQ